VSSLPAVGSDTAPRAASAGRILVVTSNFPRWARDSTTPFVLHLARGLQGLGWQVDVLAPHAPRAARREVLDGVSVERFRYLWPLSAQTVCYQGGALVNLRERRSNVLKLPALIAAEWAAVARRLARRRYDLLHSHWILPQGFVGVLAARPLGIPHVVTAHGGDVFALRGRLLQAFKRFALQRADGVTVNSSVTRAAVVAIAPQAAPVEIIPMGVPVGRPPDPTEVVALRERHRQGAGPLLAFVGRVVEEKGVEDLIRAVGILRRRHLDATAVVLGEGPHRPAFERLSAELGLSAHVRFLGWVPSESVPAYLAAADVLVAPSRPAPDGWIEAQGLSVVEAMSAGTPVVASRSGGVIDAIEDGETGLLVSVGSPTEIAAAVERLASDQALAGHLRERAARRAAERFSRLASAAAFSALFERLVGERRRR
jgi:phosphatidyl-myo-inositol dimannoside synthase